MTNYLGICELDIENHFSINVIASFRDVVTGGARVALRQGPALSMLGLTFSERRNTFILL